MKKARNGTEFAAWLNSDDSILNEILACEPDDVSTIKFHLWGLRWHSHLDAVRVLAFHHGCRVSSFETKRLWRKDVFLQVSGKTSALAEFYKDFCFQVGTPERM